MASVVFSFQKTLEVFGRKQPSFTNTQTRARRLMGGSNRVTSGTVCDAVDGPSAKEGPCKRSTTDRARGWCS
jgi:hypothetical protein